MAQTSYGERRRVEIAMALAQNPKVLLLDEPFAGLSVEERRDVLSLIAGIPRDVTIVMIEHDMDVALEFAERITVLHFGQVDRRGHARRGGRSIRAPGRSTLANDALLLSDIDAYYGDSHVLHRVSLRLGEGRLLGLLGRNGAGKSTCMNVAVGLAAAAPRRGRGATATPVDRPRAGGDRGARRGAGAAGPPHLPQPDGAREPGGGRAQPARSAMRAPWTLERVCATFPRLSERRDSTPAICQAASSRCWRSAAR